MNERTEMAIAPARLPLDPRLAKKHELDQGKWKVLCDTIFPSAKSADSIAMALEYCQARRFDIMKKPVHIVPVWSSEKRQLVETIWPGIGELRTTAMRTGHFAGVDDTIWGPEIEETFKGQETYYENREKKTRPIEVAVKYPEWAQVHVYRLVAGEKMLFAGPKVYWKETYAKAASKSLAPNAMWQQRPRGQLEKCAEAAALRRAFPEEFGGDLVAEEMEGQAWAGAGVIIDHDAGGSTPPEKPVEKTINYKAEGKEARESGEDSSAAPDHLGSADYKLWMEGWNEANAALQPADDDEGNDDQPADDVKEEKVEDQVDETQDGKILDSLAKPDLTGRQLEELYEAVDAFPLRYKDPKGLKKMIDERRANV